MAFTKAKTNQIPSRLEQNPCNTCSVASSRWEDMRCCLSPEPRLKQRPEALQRGQRTQPAQAARPFLRPGKDFEGTSPHELFFCTASQQGGLQMDNLKLSQKLSINLVTSFQHRISHEHETNHQFSFLSKCPQVPHWKWFRKGKGNIAWWCVYQMLSKINQNSPMTKESSKQTQAG